MKVLVLAGDYWHPLELVKRGLSRPEYEDYEFDFVEDAKDTLSAEFLSRYPLVVNCKGNSISAANRNPWFDPGITEADAEVFRAYVENGGGLLSLHAGTTVGLDGGDEMGKLIGCGFVRHPARCEIEIRPLKDHPITRGVKAFTIRDEHYEIEMYESSAEILLESVSESGGTQVAGYAFECGEGRIAALTPGHILSVWEHPEFIKLVKNAMNWCVKPLS